MPPPVLPNCAASTRRERRNSIARGSSDFVDFFETMSIQESASLADESAKASGESTDTDRSSQPTLLSIPQELRNKIFEYVYDTTGATHGRVDLVIIDSKNSSQRGTLITSHQTLPCKSPLLICQQIYQEMRGMQKAAYRHFWTSNAFWVSFHNSSRTLHRQLIASNENMLHIEHFVIVFEKTDHHVEVDINIGGGRTTSSVKCTPLTAVPAKRLVPGQRTQDRVLQKVKKTLLGRSQTCGPHDWSQGVASELDSIRGKVYVALSHCVY